jgi:hypothetical protein
MALVNGMYATSFLKAFFLNALALAVVAVGAIELRERLNDDKSNAYLFFNNFFSGSTLSEIQKGGIVFISSFVFSIFTYLIMYFLFGYGGGLLSAKDALNPKLNKLNPLQKLIKNIISH